jgi:thioredoxin reductase
MSKELDWDVIVVGGGAAGLSAALVLGRARQRTLVIDAGGQSNRPAEGVGGLLGHDGRPPSDLYALGREELAAYPAVGVRDGEVRGGERHADGFKVELAGGERETSRNVLLATGMEYRYADVPGIAERWGRGAFHCPFCHGWEVRDRPLAVLDSGASGAGRALLLRAWSDQVTLLANGPADLDPDDAAKLQAAGVEVDERRVTSLVGPESTLTGIAFEDGDERPYGGLLVAVTLHQRSALARQLGAEYAEPTPLSAESIAIDATFGTTVPGLFAAGDVTPRMPNVANAVASGSAAAAAIVHAQTAALGVGAAAERKAA